MTESPTSNKKNKRQSQTDPVVNEKLLEAADPIRTAVERTTPSARTIAIGAGAVAATAGVTTMAARARKNTSLQVSTPSVNKGGSQGTSMSGSTLGKGAAAVAAGVIGAAAVNGLTGKKNSPSIKPATPKQNNLSNTPTKVLSQKKTTSKPLGKQMAGYDWVSNRSVKGGGYWRKKRPRRTAIAASIGRKTKRKAVAKVKRKGRSIAKSIGKSIAKTLIASVAATAAGAGLKAIMERARRNSPSTSVAPKTGSKFGAISKKAAIVAAEAAGATAGATATAALIREMKRRGGKSSKKGNPEEDAPPGIPKTPKSPKSPNSSGGFNASQPPEEDIPPPGSVGTPKNPKSPKSPEGSSTQAPGEENATGTRVTSVSAGTAVMQRRGRKSAAQVLLPESAGTQKGAGTSAIVDPWEGEVESLPSTNSTKTNKSSDVPPSMALPSASRRLSKAQLKKAISESRDLKSKRRRTETELEKANNKIELGRSLQNKESDADKLRGIDYEMIASEKKANLEAKLAEIQSREEQLNELLSPKAPVTPPTGLYGDKNIKPVAKGMEVIEERKQRKKNNQQKEGDENVAVTQEPSPVKTEETVKTKKKNRSIVQRVTDVVSRKKKESPGKEEEVQKETSKERRKRERAEDKQLKQELIAQTGRSASKAMTRNAYKTPLNLVVPGLGDAIEKADKFFGDKSRIEKWAQELEDNGDINVSRRELFRGGKRFVAKQTAAKPKGITQELRRGAEISRDFFDQLVGGNSDEIILKGAKNRGFGAERGRKIQLTRQEYERITATYTNPQKRELLNFLQFIGFPVP